MTDEQIKQVKQLVKDEVNEAIFGLGEHLAQSLQGVVKITVNGKIDRVIAEQKEQREQILLIKDGQEKQIETFTQYVKEDVAWKDKVQPIVLEREQQKVFGLVISKYADKTMSVSKLLGAIAILVGIIWGTFVLLVKYAIINIK